MADAIIHKEPLSSAPSAKLYANGSLVLTRALTNRPNGSDRWTATETELANAGLSAGSYDIEIEDNSGGYLGAAAQPLEWDGTKERPQRSDLRQVEGAASIDTVGITSLLELLLAYVASPNTTVTDNGDGTKTISIDKQDGATEKLSLTFNSKGEWTASTIS